MTVLITHEPIINKSRTIAANRLLVHGSSMAAAVDALEEVAAEWPMSRTVTLGFKGISLDETLLDWDLPDNTLIELPANFLATPQGTELAQKLTQKKTGICISNLSKESTIPSGIFSRFGLINVPALPGAFPDAGLPIAVGIRDVSQFNAATSAGFAGASGWFFLHDKPQGKKPEPASANILHILNLVMEEADVGEIEAALKRDVSISYNLLKYVNSAAFGSSVEIQSFSQAVTMLGYKQLYKWLSVLLAKSGKNMDSQALMQTAISRGRFMETVGQGFMDKRECDNMFITGAFSLLDILLETDMQSLLENMRLPEAIADALIRKEGPYAPFLMLAQASELNPVYLADKALKMGFTPKALNRAALAALSYADSMQSD